MGRPTFIVMMCCALAAASSILANAQEIASDDTYDWGLPAWAPAPPQTPDNPTTAAKVELGRRLFYDGRLSADGMRSCASCHQQQYSFSDNLPLSWGVTGELTARNTQMLANTGYLARLTWADPRVVSLETQALNPMFGQNPVEMGMAGQQDEIIRQLQSDPVYADLFPKAFPGTDADISIPTVTQAIAAFERTLISFDSPYDRYRNGGATDAISDSARRGEALFFSERIGCGSCHPAPHFTDAMQDQAESVDAYHNTGLYNLDGAGAYPPTNIGVAAVTGRPEDMGRFKTPSLRNIAVTAPYMHDGSLATLGAVIDHYAAGGQNIPDGETNAGNGAASPLKDRKIAGFELSQTEKADLIAFLESLTDQTFLNDPRHSDPWKQAAREGG